ncbi:hypothetical protein FPQ18DRAFT_344911 [Pyronema domesticum]|nr:hypothetical protein FPQ18DRAFT_344911 [Pyronema domesticum]
MASTDIDNFEPDVIICGGGTAACIIAGRLARGNPTLNVLLIEAGENSYLVPEVIQPGSYLHQQSGSRLKNYPSIPSEHLRGKSIVVPQGHGLGGGSAVNFLMYTRASASDFDDWQTPGWTYSDLLPLLKKLETCYFSSGLTHGTWGPIAVSYGGESEANIVRDSKAAVKAIGYDYVQDAQDMNTGNAYSRWAKYVDPVSGHRQDTSHRYLHPLLASGKPNIKVLYSTQVTRILLDSSNTAVGVECVPSHSNAFSSSTPPPPKTIPAKKLVIASCGSIATPGLLERSGIGRKEVLEKAGIEHLVDLPGVGENYQDHNLIFNTYEVEEKVDTHDAFFLKTSSILCSAESDFKQGKGKYATNFVDFAGKIRPTEEAVSKMGAFKHQWESYYKNKPDKPVVLQAIVNCLLGDHSKFPQGMKFISYGNYTAYAASRGSVHVMGKNVYEAPRFDSGYLSAPEDLPMLVWGYKQGREVCRRMRCIVGEIPELNPPFDSQSKAAAQRHFERGDGWDVDKVQNIEYSEEDEKVIEEWIRENVRTAWHPLGTCAMRAKEQGGVVDKDLRVYGTSNLMVADMSICPENVGSNTNNTAMLVGEKAAVLAARFLGVEID